MKTRNIFSVLLFLVCSITSFAQYGTVRGFVYDEKNGEPLIFTNVYLQKTTYGCATDLNGYFTITKIPPGNYTLLVTAIGYDTLAQNISVKAGEFQNLKLYVHESAYQLSMSLPSRRLIGRKSRLLLSLSPQSR